MTIGARVSVVVWGERKTGRVELIRSAGIVWVRLDSGKLAWFHRESLELAR